LLAGNAIRAANSLDSLDCVTNSIQQARANSINQAHQEPVFASPQMLRINRSNSVSTRMAGEQTDFQRTFPIRKPSAGDNSEYYGIPLWTGRSYAEKQYTGQSQPTSPSSRNSKHNYETSRSVPRSYKRHESRQPPDAGKVRDEGHGSLSSLVSLGHLSSVSFLSEEKANAEIQKLRKELREEHEKVQRLSSQLSTNAHVVSAFEQSLANMTSRLSQLTLTAEEKDRELQELHKTIESLRRQGARMALESDINTRNHGFMSGTSDSDNDDNMTHSKKSLNFKQRKSRWLKRSLSKAFARTRKPSGSISEMEDGDRRSRLITQADVGTSCPGSPTTRGHHRSKSASMLEDCEGRSGNIEKLQQQLIRKDNLLTESRLEALSSAHQLHTLRETVSKLRIEMSTIRAENEKLYQERIPAGFSPVEVSPKKNYTRESSKGVLNHTPSRSPARDINSCAFVDRKGCSLLQISCSIETDLDEVLVPVSVISSGHLQRPEVKIGHVTISRNSSWIYLDDCLRGLVKTYLASLDPDNSLELSNQSMVCYQCGNIRRVFKNPEPDRRPSLLPDTRIWVSFRGGTDRGSLEDLSFTTLIPKTTIKHYISTISKYQRAVIVGHPKVGKTFLATKLAEYLVLKSGEELTPDSISVFWANKATAQQCSDFVSKISKIDNPDNVRNPSVIILENIHSQGSKIIQILSKLEGTLEDAPFIICTSTPTEYMKDLIDTHHFAEIYLGQDVELLQGFLGRYLRRKMLNIEVATRLANFDMPEAIQWILRIYCNLYIFVKTTSQTQAFLSPQMFLACPVESTASLRSWFIDLWNSALATFLRQVVHYKSMDDSLDFEDPVRFVIRTWPWQDQAEGLPQALLKVKTEAATLQSDRKRKEEEEDDPLLSMLMSLQEATLRSEDSENVSSDLSMKKFSSEDTHGRDSDS